MSDRNTAELYAKWLVTLAREPTDEHKQMAREMWLFGQRYDFCGQDMGVDAAKAEIALGIAINDTDDGGNDLGCVAWLFEDYTEE